MCTKVKSIMCNRDENSTELVVAEPTMIAVYGNKVEVKTRTVHILLGGGVFVWCPLCRQKTKSTAHICRAPDDGTWIDGSVAGRNKTHRKHVQYRRQVFDAFLKAPHLHTCYTRPRSSQARLDSKRQVVYFGKNVVDANHFSEIGEIKVIKKKKGTFDANPNSYDMIL